MTQNLVQCDADDPLKDLKVELDNLNKLDHTAVRDNLSRDSFIHFNNKYGTTASKSTNEEIVPSVLAGNNKDDDELQPGDTDFDI